jgi:phage tail tape-measure protein
MKKLLLTSLIATAVAGGAFAQTSQTNKPPPKNAGTAGGAVAGAATGALVAGPVGAVVGGVAGATIGHKTIDKKAAHHRRHKAHPAPAADKQP